MGDNVLVFYRWYTHTAVYRYGELVYYGEFQPSYRLVEALGYVFKEMVIPGVPLPHEFSRDAVGNWLPPKQESQLKDELDRYLVRAKGERVAYLLAELRELGVGDV